MQDMQNLAFNNIMNKITVMFVICGAGNRLEFIKALNLQTFGVYNI